MRRKLKMPLQFSSVGIQRQDTVSIEIVARAHATFKVRRGIAGAPVNRVELRIERPRPPRSSATVEIEFSWPAFGTEFPRTRYGPESPRQLTRQRIVGSDKATHAVVAPGSSHKDLVFNYQRGAGCAVILVPIRIGHVPDQVARARVQAEQMRIVRLHVNPVVPQPDASVDVPRCIVDQSFRNRPRMMPHDSSGACVECRRIIRSSYEHHSIHYQRSDLKPFRIARMKNPLRAQSRNIA